MGKYSSDSDYEKRSGKKHKISTRRRSSSSDTSDSKTRKRKDKKSVRYRSKSKSKDTYSKSRRSRSRSDSHHKSHKPKHRRSTSRGRSKHKRSNSRDRSRRSKDKYRSHRSRSRSYIREFVSKPKRPTSSSSDSDSVISVDRRATKAKQNNCGESSGDVKIVSDKTTAEKIADSGVLEEINCEGFVPKKFNSKKVPDNIVIDLTKQTIKVPEVEPSEPDSIFHHNLFLSEETRMEKWVKELYSYRQKALQQGLKVN